MLSNPQLISAINTQIGNEFSASMQYLAIATYFEAQTLPELAKFFYKQSDEERAHAMRFIRFVLDTGGDLVLPEIPAPRQDFKFAEDAVKLSLESELRVTQQINDIFALATQANNYITQQFLQWFLEEQVEEVASMTDLLKVVQRAGEGGLLRVEEYLVRHKPGGSISGGSTSED
jgi:ferritin